jgi:predicted NBD/HSP70 family sugar kinase
LVEVYISEINKKNTVPISEDAEYSKFRQALKATANSEIWSQISYDRIASGLNDNDPIALHVIDYAAKYLGFTVNAVITIINPAVIILGGRMITELPGFADKTISYARQFSWPIAWNNTEIKASQHGRDIQVYGAVELLLSLLNQ